MAARLHVGGALLTFGVVPQGAIADMNALLRLSGALKHAGASFSRQLYWQGWGSPSQARVMGALYLCQSSQMEALKSATLPILMRWQASWMSWRIVYMGSWVNGVPEALI